MKNLAIIPARSGSKGLPDKNILPLDGKPLLAYAIDAAKASGLFDTIHVSTDSEHYAEIAKKYGADVPFLRSAAASSDTASSWEVVLEVLANYQNLDKGFETIMLLQPTSPLRTAEDICGAYQLMQEKQAKTIVSVCEADHSPLWCNILPESGCMNGFIKTEGLSPRQQLEKYYRINGALYLLTVSELLKNKSLIYNEQTYSYVMPRERSIDIDDKLDFLIAETILNCGNSVLDKK